MMHTFSKEELRAVVNAHGLTVKELAEAYLVYLAAAHKEPHFVSHMEVHAIMLEGMTQAASLGDLPQNCVAAETMLLSIPGAIATVVYMMQDEGVLDVKRAESNWAKVRVLFNKLNEEKGDGPTH